MVDDSPTPRPHPGLPMAPRLQRSMRLRRALHLKQPVKLPPSRTGQSWRRGFSGKSITFMFMAAQLLIAILAFVLVRDYMADGYIKNAVSDIFYSGAIDGNDSKLDQEVTIVVKPPTAQGKVPNQEITVQKLPAPIEPVETPPSETQKSVVSAESKPQAEEQVTTPVVEPEPVPQAVAPIAAPTIEPEPLPPAEPQVIAPFVEPEPAPQIPAAVATPAIAPETASKAEQQVAVAPIPDLTPLKDAPAAPLPSEPAKPEQAEEQPFRDCATCPEMVGVSPGRFVMGAGSEGSGQQVSVTTAQDVAIAAPFAIGRFEITFDEWSQCVTDGGCTSQPADENWGRGRRPVINVSFNDITQQYLPWLSRKAGFTYRLPTEAEWEFAARGGAAAPAGLAYSFGDDTALLCAYGNSSDLACSDGYATTAPAGSLKPNGLGLFDMHGNVWEWMADCWRPQYSVKPVKSAEACTARVLRGGSWASAAPALRSAARGWEQQDKSKNSIGFRVARSQP